MRGLASSGTVSLGGGVHVLLEHSNRGKQSLGLDLASEDGLDILYKLAATCDVFLTNKLPSVRTKLKIDVDDIRAHNPNIIYVRGHGQGEPRARRRPRLVRLARYWCRAGIALGVQAARRHVPPPPAPAFGDSIGAMTIAGGDHGRALPPRAHRRGHDRRRVAARHRPLVDGRGDGAVAAAQRGVAAAARRARPTGNPLVSNYRTKDDRFVALCCLQAAKYWPEACEVIGRPELARRRALRGRRRHQRQRRGRRPSSSAEAFAERTLDEWREAARRLLGAVGRRAGHARGRRRSADRRQRLRRSTARRPTARRSSSSTAPMQYDERARATEAGAGVQRARRRDPRRPRPRLGHDHRPQGPRRRRLTTEIPPPTRNPTQSRDRSVSV